MVRVSPHGHRRWSNRVVTREYDHSGRRWLWGMVLGVVVASTPLVRRDAELAHDRIRAAFEAFAGG